MILSPTAPFALSALHCAIWVVDVRLPSLPTLDSRNVNCTSLAWSRVLTVVGYCAQQRLVRLAIRKVSAQLWPRAFSTRERGRSLMRRVSKLSLQAGDEDRVDSSDQAPLPSCTLPLCGKRIVITRRREQSREL